ncbi:50S ribosomal protein L10 [Candidatus Parcubacteria bacterium]|nr:50S ribosomal protein L10 [Candidatus Parcubacteria bacterium]
MALSKQAKEQILSEVSELLDKSKLTVVANYKGTTVKNLQDLRKQAGESGTKVRVVKNTLVIKALEANDRLKNADTSQLSEQLLYAFNSEDEVAPAQVLAKFSKKAKKLRFIGAITDEGVFMAPDDVKALAELPSKPQLIASVVATLNSPVNDVLGGLSSGINGILSGLEARAA